MAPVGLNKICDLIDFEHPELRSAITAIFPHERDRFGSAFPRGREYRKYWEVAMASLAMRHGGALHPQAEILGVGAGAEPTLFWLTNHVKRVHATDLYSQDGEWSASANDIMLSNPGFFWPGAWNRRRLIVQHADARELPYEDESFDGVFSSSSIEHFGTQADIRRAVTEIHRVLKVRGVLSLSTEFRLAGPPPGIPGTLLFDLPMLTDTIFAAAHWEMVTSIDLSCSEQTRAAETPFREAVNDLQRHTDENDGRLVFHKLEWSRYPHIVLREKDRAWTSIHLCLRKR